ncbi:hypothetical protein TI01_2455 [Lysobacter sp. A03]|nr:hypothetical protein TI01_2455 [Lysobacter sp. A03]
MREWCCPSGAGHAAADATILAEPRRCPALNAKGQPKLPRCNRLA